jgi:hypothetical protein
MAQHQMTTQRVRASETSMISAVLVVAVAMSVGCVKRRIGIETDPPGALVWLNDAQVGRTPVDVSFTHHGVYDLRIEKEGFEPLVTSADTAGPMWDEVPLDFVMELLPGDLDVSVRWKFTLVVRDDAEAALLTRAGTMRARVRSEGVAAAGTAETASRQSDSALEPTPEMSGETRLENLEKSVSDRPTTTESGREGVPTAPPPTPDTPPNALPRQ